MTRERILRGANALITSAFVSFLSLSFFALSASAQNWHAPVVQAPVQQSADADGAGSARSYAGANSNAGPSLGSAAPGHATAAPSQTTAAPAVGSAAAAVSIPQLSPSNTAASSTVVTGVLEQGIKLESQRRWAEAFALYEDTARLNSGTPDAELTQHLDLAKMHFDIGRRYADSTYRKNISSLSDTEALDVFTDSATKIQSHYVINPDWSALVNRGANDLQIALSEKSYQEANLNNQATNDRIDLFVRELRRLQTQHPVKSLSDARNNVWNAAQMAQSQLGIRPASTMLEFTAAMLGGLDEYSSYLTAGQLNDLYSQIEGNFVGLGVELKAADGALLIVNVIHNSPAERGGIKAGDKIVSVGGRATADVTTDKAAEMLQGAEGSSVELAVVSPNEEPRQLKIKRAHVDVSSVDEVKMVDSDFGIGYFKLNCFQKTTSQDVDKALWELHRQGMRSLILDLRGNPGGLLTAAVDVANKFIDPASIPGSNTVLSSIVSTRGRSPGEDFNYTARGGASWRIPIVVLIDGDSASAAEILSGAMRDYHRATIVGVRSYGKGCVQGIFPLGIGGGGVRLTTAKFYSPLGKEFSHVGVDPDVKVQVAAKPIDGRITLPVSTGGAEDVFLNAGLQVARRQVAQR